MHIPDGFLAPQTYLPAFGLAAAAWAWAARGLRDRLDEELVPRLAAMTALAYGLGLMMVPIPGGTSGHVLGVAMLALLFGVRLAFLAYSLVLLMQALLFGAGGITALPVNALGLGLLGAASAAAVFRALRGLHETGAVALAAWVSVVLPAIIVALVLGAQPLIAVADDGSPLFFPFGPGITLPAVVLPHLAIALGEAMLTVLVWRFAQTRRWCLPAAKSSGGSGFAPGWRDGAARKPRLALLAYLAAVLAVSLLQQPWLLASLLMLVLVASGSKRWILLRRACLGVLTFNLVVSVGYLLLAFSQDHFSARYLLLINLRVLLLVFLGFWFVARVNLLEAASFSPTLRLVLTLAAGQVQVFTRLVADFGLALRSRSIREPAFTDRTRHAAAQAQHLLDKSVAMANEAAQAMRSRGAFAEGATTLAAPGTPRAASWRAVRVPRRRFGVLRR